MALPRIHVNLSASKCILCEVASLQGAICISTFQVRSAWGATAELVKAVQASKISKVTAQNKFSSEECSDTSKRPWSCPGHQHRKKEQLQEQHESESNNAEKPGIDMLKVSTGCYQLQHFQCASPRRKLHMQMNSNISFESVRNWHKMGVQCVEQVDGLAERLGFV